MRARVLGDRLLVPGLPKRRTMLDMEGVFAGAEEWFEKAHSDWGAPAAAKSGAAVAANSLMQESAIAGDDVVTEVAREAGMDAKEAAQMMVGSGAEGAAISDGIAPAPLTTKQLSDSVITGLSDEDRQTLEAMMKDQKVV